MNIADSPPRRRLLIALAVLGASAFAGQAARAGDEEPSYFSERFGGRIERVVVGPDGTIYVAGIANVADLPASTSTPVPGSNAYGPYGLFFAAALESDGRPRWTSYVRGLARDFNLSVRGLAVAPDGAVWIGGYGIVDPVAAFQPEPGGYSDAIVAKFAADGTLLFASNLGGEGTEDISGLAVDANGDAIVVGTTNSRDFPLAPLPPEFPRWTTDAFVARLLADGSGFAWMRRFGNDIESSRFGGGDVAVDPSDGSIVVTMTGVPSQGRGPFATGLSPPRTDPPIRVFPWELDPLVIRLDSEGVQSEGAQLLGLGSEWGWNPLPVLIGADRSVLVGGLYGVGRTTPELFLAMTDVWMRRGRTHSAASITRIGTDPSGRVVIATAAHDQYGSTFVRIVALDSSLAEGEAPVDRGTELGFTPLDIAVDSDGSLLVVGRGRGVSFRAPYDRDSDTWTGCIARVPLDGVRAPTRLRARVVGTRDVDLSWSRDGDAASGFDIERVGPDSAPLLVGHVAGEVFRFRATGLTPGAHHGLRVVAVFPSGVRSASPVRDVTTPPEALLELVALDGPGRTIDVQGTAANGDAAYWIVQRRFGDGPWMDATALGQSASRTDLVPDVAVPVRYRARAAQWHGPRTGWIESAPIVPASSLRVVQTRGRFGPSASGGVELFIEGTFAPTAGAGPVSFDPATQEFRLLYGFANSPAVFALPPGYPGWTVADGVARWRAADSLTGWDDGSEIALDLAHGTFLVRLIVSYWTQYQPIGSIAVNLEFGAYSGGDVELWRGTPAREGPLWFDAEKAGARGARTR